MLSFNKIPLIGNDHSDETRNIINLMVQVINNRGIEILSDSAFLNWLDENGVKHLGEWDNAKEYDRLSVVLHEGNSYTSKKQVPAGIDIYNEEFWALTGNYNAQIEYYRQDVNDSIDDIANDLKNKDDYNHSKMSYNGDNFNILEPTIVIIDDDGGNTHFTQFKNAIMDRGMVACMALVSDWTLSDGQTSRVQPDELLDLQNNHGWEMMSHGLAHQHLTQLSFNELQEELEISKKNLNDVGFNINGLVYPYGFHDERVLSETRKTYKYAFGDLGYAALPLRSNLIRRVSFDNSNFEEFKVYIDRIKRDKRLLVINTHFASYSEQRRLDFIKVLDYIKDENIKVSNFKDAYKTFGNLSENYNERTGDNFTIDYKADVYKNGEKFSKFHQRNVNDITSSDYDFENGITTTLITRVHAEENDIPLTQTHGVIITTKISESSYEGVLYQELYGLSSRSPLKRTFNHNNNQWYSWYGNPLRDTVTYEMSETVINARSVRKIGITNYLFKGNGVITANPDTTNEPLENIFYNIYYDSGTRLYLQISNPTDENITLKSRNWMISYDITID